MANIEWNGKMTGEKCQFVAEVMNESLFDYSFDSNKVPSLNLHYFCDEYMQVSALIKKGNLQEGNLKPLNDEFKHIINNSIWLPKNISKSIFLFKNKSGFYINASKNEDSAKINEYYKENAHYISNVLESEYDYFEILIKRIEELLNDTDFTFEKKAELYFCLREFLSELINFGVSKGDLYNRIQKKLFSRISPQDDIKYVMSFLQSLLPVIHKYSIVFGIAELIYKETDIMLKGLRAATEKEKIILKCDYVAENTFNATDSVSALKIAKSSFSVLLSVYNSCMHNTERMILCNGLVKEENETKYSFIKDSLNVLIKNPNKEIAIRRKWLSTVIDAPIQSKLLSAFELHNNALQIDDAQTQLLNLWTINELLIETNQTQMNKVNYISNIICTVLCLTYYNRYIDSIYKQIIKTVGIAELVKKEPRGDTHTKKLSYIIKDNVALRQQIIQKLKKHPLSVYKIESFTKIFSSKELIKKDLIRHSNRVRWQVMRIYRTRCMIVHDGTGFSQEPPYLNSIVENLHYYVDELFNYIFKKREEGIYDLRTILSCARISEASVVKILENKDNTLTDEEFYQIIADE